MSGAKIKDDAHRLVDNLDDEATWDDLMYEIYVRQAIERGLADSDAGRSSRQRFLLDAIIIGLSGALVLSAVASQRGAMIGSVRPSFMQITTAVGDLLVLFTLVTHLFRMSPRQGAWPGDLENALRRALRSGIEENLGGRLQVDVPEAVDPHRARDREGEDSVVHRALLDLERLTHESLLESLPSDPVGDVEVAGESAAYHSRLHRLLGDDEIARHDDAVL